MSRLLHRLLMVPTALLVFASESEQAQVDDIVRDLNRQRVAVLASLKLAPDSMLQYRPVPGVRSFVEQLEHIGLAADALSAAVTGEGNPPAMDVGSCRCTQDRKALESFLTRAFDHTLSRYNQLSPAERRASYSSYGQSQSREAWFRWIQEHTAWTLGQVVPYLRLNGVAPPPYFPF